MIIFTNRRAIRSFTLKFKGENREVENLISISEFNEKAIYIDSFKKINNLEREVIFNSVVKELKGERVFNIDTNIFNFLSYSRYFFAFFKELAEENIKISEIQDADYYDDYRKHIDILEIIHQKYREEMRSRKYIDDIFTPLDYKINIPYIKSLEKIEYRFQGRLSAYQIDIFSEIAKQIPVTFLFVRSRFNRNIDTQIGVKLKQNREYQIDFSSKKIISETKVGVNSDITIHGFKNSFAQVGFIKERIWYFHEKLGIPLEEIGVVLLDENFAKTLKIFGDGENPKRDRNLNFAMGQDIKDTPIFKFLNGIYLYIENKESREHKARKDRILNENENLQEIFIFFVKNWHKNFVSEFRTYILKSLKEFDFNKDKTLIMNILEKLHLFESKNLNSLNIRTLLRLFLQEIGTLTIDDTKGGKVTVQGLLETRGANYKAVIVLDFNDDVFPKIEEKDFFINSEIRRELKLPIIEDREALQKLYLESLLQKAEYGAISFLDSDTTKISRFFHDFNFTISKYSEDFEKKLIDIAILNGEQFFHWNSDDSKIIANYKFSAKPLSNSKLRNFQECPRRFYLSNIINIKEHSFEESIELLIGSTLHRVLERVYKERDHFLSSWELYSIFEIELNKEKKVPKIYISSWLQRLKKFSNLEVERFQSGVKVFALEKSVTIENYRGFKLTGKIDRIDILPDGKLILIDYKLSNPSKFDNFFSGTSENDFQLIFYYTLLKESGEDVDLDNLYYYNLTSGEMIKNSKTVQEFNEVLDNLKKIESEDIDFDKNDKCSRFCQYKIICNVG